MRKRYEKSDVGGRAKKARRSASGVTAKMLAIAVKKQIMKSAETKESDFADIVTNTTVVNGYAACLNVIAEGTDYTNRIGRHITPKYVRVDFFITGPTGVTNLGQFNDCWYAALVWDRQPDGNLVTYNTIYDFSAGNGHGQPFKATSTSKDRFKILKEERGFAQAIEISAVTAGGNVSESTRCHMYVDLSKLNLRCEFGASGATTPTVGALYWVFGSNNNTGATTTSAGASINCRFAFTDM